VAEPLVSIIIPFFNEERYIADAITSVLAQTHQDIEVILVDDDSTDRSPDICRSFRDSRIRILRKDGRPRGLAASRNMGIADARGQYVALQDADDVSAPTRIEEQLAAATERPGKRVVGCTINRVKNGKAKVFAVPETHAEIVKGFNRTWNRTTIVCGTILAPREAMLKIPYRTDFKYMQDWDHILRLYESELVSFYNCQKPLYTYFIRSKGVLNRPDWIEYNLLVRSCQQRRRQGLDEFLTLPAFRYHLRIHPIERVKWQTLKRMILLRDKCLGVVQAVRAYRSNLSGSPAGGQSCDGTAQRPIEEVIR
jgi:glycosyltransferase involved in cell wall biosynthesis